MKTLFSFLFVICIISFTFFSCGKESPVEPVASNSDNQNELQTDGEEEDVISPLVSYTVYQDYICTPVGSEVPGSGVSVVLLDSYDHISSSPSVGTWSSIGYNFTPNATFTSNGYLYTPMNNQVTVLLHYQYTSFCCNPCIGYCIKNQLRVGSTTYGTYDNVYFPCSCPTGGYNASSETYTTSGNVETHTIYLGFVTKISQQSCNN